MLEAVADPETLRWLEGEGAVGQIILDICRRHSLRLEREGEMIHVRDGLGLAPGSAPLLAGMRGARKAAELFVYLCGIEAGLRFASERVLGEPRAGGD